uniref:NADH dehydrogenase subunit 6 n=1 Tax=Leipothrix sp. 1 XFX-2017 TaxID=1955440 RepID=A0A1S5XVZ2_9ACAR|nr:NADH dehydrogenase subunit 6 [Leipothrix sp. 1 XFX-2017]
MITFIPTILLVMMTVSLYAANPMKMLALMSSMSLLLAHWMMMCLSTTWPPLILLLLFLGGILVSFMVVSSILPNQKTYSGPSVGVLSMVSMGMACLSFPTKSMDVVLLKATLYAGGNMSFFLLMIMAYFFIFLAVTSGMKKP